MDGEKRRSSRIEAAMNPRASRSVFRHFRMPRLLAIPRSIIAPSLTPADQRAEFLIRDDDGGDDLSRLHIAESNISFAFFCPCIRFRF